MTNQKDLLLFVPIDRNVRGQREFFPLGVLYIASQVEKIGFSVDVLHDHVEALSTLENKYRFFGVSSTTSQYPDSIRALQFIRQYHPESKIILGGAHLNSPDMARQALDMRWDYIISGPGEVICSQILQGKCSPGLYIGTQPDINSLPMPAYNKLPLGEYSFPLGEGKRCATVITSRGCPYKCAFCSTSNTKLYQTSAESVVEELKWLRDKGFDSFMFVDDTMSINWNRFHKILDGLQELDVIWRSYGRISALNEECLEHMKKSGCIEVAIGVESGNQQILDLIGKGTTPARNTKFVEDCKRIGIRCNAMMIIGLPGETEETAEDTIKWTEKAKPDAFGYNMFMPFPDSPIFLNQRAWAEYITIHPYTFEEAFTKGNTIDKCFVSTPTLDRNDILTLYRKNFERLVQITGFDPRKRGEK